MNGKNYFDLTIEDDLTNLSIQKKDRFECQLIDNSDNIYDGFKIAQSKKGNIFTVCDIDFHISGDEKYKARLTFRKVDKNFETKTRNNQEIIIPFKRGQDGYRKFWKMTGYLYEWLRQNNSGEFEDYFSVTDKNLGEVLSQISSIENKNTVLSNLGKLSTDDLSNIDNLVNITKIKKILDVWRTNKENENEFFWQKLFKENSFILSQIFACPFIFIQEQFFCGGKTGSNKGGIEADFIYQNKLTNNTAFIEIKTPKTDLINRSLYLGKNDGDNNAIYSIATKLTGGINEVLNQRNTFIQKKDSLEESTKKHSNFKCVFIGGNISSLSEGQRKSFELYRSSLQNVDVITYDELFERIKSILELFKD